MKHDPQPCKDERRELTEERDNLTSFPPLTDKEAADQRAWADFDRASIYAS